jgi:hypothetical protein
LPNQERQAVHHEAGHADARLMTRGGVVERTDVLPEFCGGFTERRSAPLDEIVEGFALFAEARFTSGTGPSLNKPNDTDMDGAAFIKLSPRRPSATDVTVATGSVPRNPDPRANDGAAQDICGVAQRCGSDSQKGVTPRNLYRCEATQR